MAEKIESKSERRGRRITTLKSWALTFLVAILIALFLTGAVSITAELWEWSGKRSSAFFVGCIPVALIVARKWLANKS